MSESNVARLVVRHRLVWALVALLLIGLAVWWFAGSRTSIPEKKAGYAAGATPPVPVKIEIAKVQDLDIYLRGLGTVTAFATVTVRSRVQGELVEIPFKEGDKVKAGDLLARIDPRPYKVALDQAKGTLAQDVSQYENAKLDLKRYKTLKEQKSIAGQTVDTQMSLVKKYQAIILTDQAAVDNAQLQLDFTRIVAPISGRLGLRQFDVGNILVTNDPQGIVVLTQTQPISLVFTLPESNLSEVRDPMLAGKTLTVDAYDRADTKRLGQGVLMTVDNQIDVTTGTFKLKAQFANDDDALFPNQFVNVRILVRTLKDALTVSAASVQQSSQGAFLYVLQADGSAAVKQVKVGPRTGDRVVILEGITAGDKVVLEGTDRLRAGSKVRVIGDGSAPPASVSASDSASLNPPLSAPAAGQATPQTGQSRP